MACDKLTAEKLIEIIEIQLGDFDFPVTLKTTLFDLNMDSLDVIELAMAIEDASDCTIDEAEFRDRCESDHNLSIGDLLDWLQPAKAKGVS